VVFLVLETVDDDLERLVVFAFLFLHAEHDVAVHLDETAVAIPGEPLVLCGRDQREHRLIVQPEIQNRVHHAGHGVARAGADGYQEWHPFRVAKFAAHDALHVRDAGFHLRLKFLGIGLFVLVIVRADLGGHGEARRHGQPDARHLSEVRALAAQQRLH
jgi:hypothetical protein